MAIALIPARAGSVRVPGKNMRLLGGKPLLQWTIEAARESGVFDDIAVSTEDPATGLFAVAEDCVWIRRPVAYATAESPDIEWVQHAIDWLKARDIKPDILAILRPTSPFRDADTIRNVMAAFKDAGDKIDSVRCVRLATEHPAKIWFSLGAENERLLLMGPAWRLDLHFYGIRGQSEIQPAHSRPTQTLRKAYVQTAGMEIVWREVVERTGTISGERIHGYLLEGPAALDINAQEDWEMAEKILRPGGLGAI